MHSINRSYDYELFIRSNILCDLAKNIEAFIILRSFNYSIDLLSSLCTTYKKRHSLCFLPHP